MATPEAVVGELAKILVSKLIEITKDEFNLMRNFKRDREELHGRLKEMEEFLAYAESRDVKDLSIKNWLKKLEDVVYDADYVLDEIKYENFRRNIMSQTQPPRRLRFSWYNRFAFRSKMAHKIKRINAILKAIDDNATKNCFKTEVKQAAPILPLIEETDSITVDPNVVGRENDISEIVKKITTPTNDVLLVVPICGMGGIGKTTLARQIFNHDETKKHFTEMIWICVSNNFDALVLFKKMIKSMEETYNLAEDTSRQDVLKKLQAKMTGKRYLLVLDNLSNENEQDWDHFKHDWDRFKNTLLGVNSYIGNVIIITSRSEGVAETVNPFMDPHSLSVLTDGECWSIIKARAFQNEQVLEKIETIGKEIASKCRGLPLVANMIGGTLQGKEEDEWISIQNTMLSNTRTYQNTVLQILKVSYDRLASPLLKKCFAYCSIFIKDTFINRESVIQQWMGKGFLFPNLGSDMETIGNTYFEILLKNSFFQEAKKDKYGNIEGCKMHDLVHDLACLVSNSESFTVHPGNPIDNIPKVRYLGLISLPKAIQEMLTTEKANYLHTLILQDTDVSGLGKIFPHLKKLHVLVLINASVEDCPTSIGKLIHLRYLDMSQNEIGNLPSTVCKLYNLQTLRITGCEISELPDDLQHLTDLRHLELDVFPHIKMPPNMSKLTSLQTLPVFNVSDKKGCGVDELGNLKNLGGKLTIHRLQLVKGKAEAESADLVRKPRICKLVFVWGETRSDSVTNRDDEHVLEGLQPHPNIKSVKIQGFKGQRFPSWTMKMAIHKERLLRVLDNLIEVTLSKCSECEEIPAFGHLPHLKDLTLQSLDNVRSIGLSFYHGNIDDSSSTCSDGGQLMKVFFPALENLQLIYLPKLTEWVELSVTETQRCGLQIFPCLKAWEVLSCPMLMTAPSHFPCLKTLIIGGMDSELPLRKITSNITSLIHLSISYISNLTCLPDKLLYNNQDIEILQLEDCHNLDNAQHLQGWGTSLKKLEVYNCEKLRELPVDLQSVQSLEQLALFGCPNLKSVKISRGMMSLQRLYISHCSYLKFSVHTLHSDGESKGLEFPEDLREMKSLHDLTIWNCGELNSFLEGIEELSWLKKLCLGPFADSVDLNDSPIGFESLQSLTLYGNPLWDSLPDQLQNLSCLEELYLEEFGVEALPKWLGKLSSLEKLTLRSLEKLQEFPAKQVMQCLTKLHRLNVTDCPMWEERLLHGSEWSKISHVPLIYIDGTKYEEEKIKKPHNSVGLRRRPCSDCSNGEAVDMYWRMLVQVCRGTVLMLVSSPLREQSRSPIHLSSKTELHLLTADPKDPPRTTDQTRRLGLVVCRGAAVMLVSPHRGNRRDRQSKRMDLKI